MAPSGFDGRTVLLLESRRATELGTLVRTFGGQPLVAPTLREVPLATQTEAVAFAEGVIAGRFDCVIFLTGVGTRLLVDVVGAAGLREPFAAALGRTRVLSRGPKPMPVLRDLGVPVWALAPEPNTWREVVATLDAKAGEFPLAGARVAVQEYGTSSVELLDALRERGADVTRLLLYGWALPEDLEPLRAGIRALCSREVDVVLITSGIQFVHLWKVADEMGLADQMSAALRTHTVIASIGPTATETVARQGLTADLEASHPKMGVLVTEAAARSADLIATKRRA